VSTGAGRVPDGALLQDASGSIATDVKGHAAAEGILCECKVLGGSIRMCPLALLRRGLQARATD